MKVPMLQGASVQPEGLRSQAPLQISPSSALEKGVEELGQGVALGVSQIQAGIARAEEKAKEVATGDGLTAFQAAIDEEEYGTPDKDNIESAFSGVRSKSGILHLKGVDASEQSAGALDRIAAKRDEIASKIKNPDAKERYLERSSKLLLEARRRVEQHVGRQLDVAAEATDKAQREMALTDIGENYDDPTVVARRKALIEPMVRARSLSPEEAAAQLEQFDRDATIVRLGGYIEAKEWPAARKLLDESRGKLGRAAIQLQKTIEAGVLDADAEANAAAITENSIDQQSGWVYAPRALYELDQLPDGALKDETRKRLEHRLSLAEREKTKAIDDRFNNALSAYLKAGTLSAVNPADKAFLQSELNDPMKWVQLENIARAHERNARGGGGGGGAREALGRKIALAQLQVDMVDHPEKYTQMPVQRFISEWYPKLDPKDWEQAGGLLASAHGKALKPDQLSPLEVKALLQRGRDRGLFPEKQNDVSKFDDEQASIYYDAVSRLQEWAAAEKLQTGKAPTFEKMQGEIDRLLLPGFKPDSGFQGFFKTKTTPLQSGEGLADFEPDWSDTQKEDAIKRIRQMGREPTDALIEQVLRRIYRLPSLPIQRTAPEPKAEPLPELRAPARKTERVY